MSDVRLYMTRSAPPPKPYRAEESYASVEAKGYPPREPRESHPK